MAEILLCGHGPQTEAFANILTQMGHSSRQIERDDGSVSFAGSRLAILDFDSIAEPRDDLWQRVSQCNPAPRILIIASQKPADAAQLFLRYSISNLLARNDRVHEGDFRNTVGKILGADIFGVARYLKPNTPILEETIVGSAQKARLLEMAAEYATRAGLKRQAIDRVESVIDEMLTNAVYDAPMGGDGKPRYASLHRSHPVVLEPHERSTLRMGADGERFVMSVSDPFGGLTANRVLGYLAKCFRQGDDQIDEKEGGAGLGLYMMFNALTHFIINIDPGRRTEVIGVMDITPNFRALAGLSKSFNIFVRGSNGG